MMMLTVAFVSLFQIKTNDKKWEKGEISIEAE